MTAKELMAKLEAAEVKSKAFEAKAKELEEKLGNANTQIDNLDKSFKELKDDADALRKEVKGRERKTFDMALRESMDAHKDEMKSFVEDKGKASMSIKLDTSNITNTSMGVQLDPAIHSDKVGGTEFLDAFGETQRTGNILEWLEGSDTDNVGYVGELAEPTASSYTVAGKTRKFAKIGTYIQVSQEARDWFEQVYNWARTRGIARLLKKASSLIYSGDGNDTTAASHVYGLKTSGSTAFAATGAKYKKAHVGDVILDAIAQVRKNGYAANLAFVNYKTEAALRGVKDENGNYLYNQVTATFGGVRVVATADIGDTELMVCDSSCVEVYGRGQYELELERLAGKDGWNCWLRKSFQVKVPGPEKKGVIYVANIDTAITAIAETETPATDK